MSEQPHDLKPFKIDYDYEPELNQFADQMEHVPEEMTKWIESLMDDTESKDFYRGLLAGYAGCTGLVQQLPVGRLHEAMQAITSHLAAKLRKMNNKPKIHIPSPLDNFPS